MKNKLSRGRPINSDKQLMQKERLLDATMELIAQKSYRSITIRDIGQTSGINAAMVSYYFENKEGLFIALLDRISQQHFAQMQLVLKNKAPIKCFINMMISKLTENSSFARLVHDEILTNKSPLSAIFMEKFPKRMAQLLPRLILDHTAIADPKKAKYAAFTLVSMIITPFIAAPVRQQAWQISDTDIADPQWAEHIYNTFMFGCNTPSTSSNSHQFHQQQFKEQN